MPSKQKENMFGAADAPSPEAPAGRMKKRGDGATTITLTISREDKALVKILAAKKGMAVSDLLHQWITESCAEEQEG